LLERERLFRYLRQQKDGATVFYRAVDEVWAQRKSSHVKHVEIGDALFARVKKGCVDVITREEKERLDAIELEKKKKAQQENG